MQRSVLIQYLEALQHDQELLILPFLFLFSTYLMIKNQGVSLEFELFEILKLSTLA